MQLAYLSLGETGRRREIVVEPQQYEWLPPTALYLTVPRLGSVYDAPDLVYKKVSPSLRQRVGPTIVRSHAATPQPLKTDAALIDDFLGRLDRTSFFLLESKGPGEGHRLSEISRGPKVHSVESELALGWIETLRTAEFKDWASRPGALLPANEEFHYEGPNGNHYSAFLRPGFAFSSVADLDAAAFWLVEFVTPRSLIVVDNWNVSALGLQLADYVRAVDPLRSTPPSVECIEGYEATPRTFAVHAARAVHEENLEEITLIVSVNSTGRFAETHRAELLRAASVPVRTVCLYATDRDSVPDVAEALHLLDTSHHRMEPSDCRHCAEGTSRSPVVRVLPSTYLMELSGAISRAKITKRTAREVREFFNKYSGIGVVSVHRDQHDGVRHHMIHVDVTRLLENPKFKRRLREKARSIEGPVSVVLTPEHEAAISLGRSLAGHLEADHVALNETRLGHMPAATRQTIMKGGGLVIADDVAITGTRLAAYKRALRDSGIVTHGSPIDVWAVVGVARPPRSSAIQGIQDFVPERFRAIEQVFLPDWEEDDECPWCVERLLLEERLELVGAHPTLRARLDRLRATDVGLESELFLRWPRQELRRATGIRTQQRWEQEAHKVRGIEPVDDLPWELGPTSIFGEIEEVEVFTAVAAALQVLRDHGELAEELQAPLAKVLDPDLYILGRFYDSVILASLLRAGHRHDFRAAAMERVLRRSVGIKLLDETYLALRAEILYAISLGKLPRPRELADHRRELLSGEVGVCSFLAAILE